ncbi:U3 snoRNP-associated protein Rrp5 [Phanerochaete sordida]|uniref:U3 snoRNP-associated protein Rrp5 n=1 Tax=Phanerochaete sordida TaxID=48140 RepID=A0A9P3L9W6_9APHY|nr:U3 snoRNP-associated protein Rrp5 [Phanerochaete sordida]
MAAGTKRANDGSAAPKAKKTKVDHKAPKQQSLADKPAQPTSSLLTEEVDFPRGGGTSFTPIEVKAIRAEAVKEANEELFKEKAVKTSQRDRRKSESKKKDKKAAADGKQESHVRIEHLNYKRVTVGMKILGQVMSVEPLALIVSLPNQLLAHVPITNVSSQLTQLLESMDEDEPEDDSDASDDEEGTSMRRRVPELHEIFRPGQYVRAVVTAVHAAGSTDTTGFSRTRDESHKASRRVELSLFPEKVNEGVAKADLKAGFACSAAVKSVEDHGYILDMGVPEISGFLSFKDAKQSPHIGERRLTVGHLLDVCVTKLSSNGRTCNVTVNPESVASTSLTEVSNVSSIVPGALVSALVTMIQPTGLNLQVLGFYNGTVDQFHLPPGDVEDNFKLGQKVKARVLYDISPSTPPRFALSLAAHVVALADKTVDGAPLRAAFAVGTPVDPVRVLRVEPERGLVVHVAPALEGVVHISQVADEHVPALAANAGPWKVGTMHRARVTGYHPLDGLLQLSMKPSVLEQKFLQVGEVKVGEVIKGSVKKLTDSALFVSISGNVDGVIWPNHYADIHLKHPQKRFKPGGSIKCRILVVDAARKRIVLTAKKTLIDSSLPIVASLDDAKEGVVTHAVVFKASEKSLQVEFYNNLKAIVPIREASETTIASLPESFPVGKVVQVRIISTDAETGRIVASIRQASANFKDAIAAIQDVEIGHTVEGVVSEIQKEKAVLTLQPTQVRALLSLNNLANRRGVTVAQLRGSLAVGERLTGLVVTSRNAAKGFVLVASAPREKDTLPRAALSLESVQPGQRVGGRVVRHVRAGALVKLSARLSGVLHPTDVSDDYEAGAPFPPLDTIVKAAVVAVDVEKRTLTLSTRRSVMDPAEHAPVADPVISSVADLKVGATVRGFIKSVAEHGLFVTLGRNVDARVQIKELFDDYVKDWKSRFQANQLVKGRILSVDVEKKQVEMTFRSADASRNAQSTLKLSDFSEGQKVDAVVKKIEDYGLFLEIEGSKVRGLCHKSELSDNAEADVTMALRSFREGDKVKTVILSIDTEKRRISFGLKPSYFAEEDFQEEESEEEADQESLGVVDEEEEQDQDGEDNQEDEDEEAASDAEDNEEDEDEETMDVDVDVGGSMFTNAQAKAGPSKTRSALKLDDGFQWSAKQPNEDVEMESSEDESDGEDQPSKKKKRKAKEIEVDLTADLQTKMPESNADFERVLLGSPNSSFLWVQYMSFQLQLSEVEKAREIAQRALKTISFREEQEKLNVWIALLNLENVYGTEESLEATFKDAARHNDSKTIHLRMAAILEQSEKTEKAEEQFKKTAKKFGQSSKVWTLYAEYYLRHGKLEEARALLPRSLQSLEKRKHLKTISKFAQLEYKLGDPERGKTIFEGIVESHPKRWDLWSIYIDMEAGQGDIMSLRNLFDRVLAQKMTSHKAKSFFKKWLELERRIGDEEGADAVKAKAIEWTRRAAGESA